MLVLFWSMFLPQWWMLIWVTMWLMPVCTIASLACDHPVFLQTKKHLCFRRNHQCYVFFLHFNDKENKLSQENLSPDVFFLLKIGNIFLVTPCFDYLWGHTTTEMLQSYVSLDHSQLPNFGILKGISCNKPAWLNLFPSDCERCHPVLSRADI